MKNKKLLTIALACCAGALWSGCYTVLQNPNAVSSLHEEEWSAEDDYAASSDRYAEEIEADDDDFYRYPGVPGSYGSYGGAGYPVSRYGRSYGSYYDYNNYGYGGSFPYGAYADYGGYGYGPYSYGYDPYYTDRRGYYVPPGYELVNTRELDDIRASLGGVQSGGAKPLDAEAIRAQQRRKEEVWTQRVAPQMRKAPTPARSSASTVSSPPSSSTSRTSVSSPSSSSTPASKTTSTKSSTKPTKRRR